MGRVGRFGNNGRVMMWHARILEITAGDDMACQHFGSGAWPKETPYVLHCRTPPHSVP
jgi:hypothetical protein